MASDEEKAVDRQFSQATTKRESFSNDTLVDDSRGHQKSTPLDAPAASYEDEPNWPTDKKAYFALFGCFLLMFNSWGIINAYGSKCV